MQEKNDYFLNNFCGFGKSLSFRCEFVHFTSERKGMKNRHQVEEKREKHMMYTLTVHNAVLFLTKKSITICYFY